MPLDESWTVDHRPIYEHRQIRQSISAAYCIKSWYFVQYRIISIVFTHGHIMPSANMRPTSMNQLQTTTHTADRPHSYHTHTATDCRDSDSGDTAITHSYTATDCRDSDSDSGDSELSEQTKTDSCHSRHNEHIHACRTSPQSTASIHTTHQPPSSSTINTTKSTTSTSTTTISTTISNGESRCVYSMRLHISILT